MCAVVIMHYSISAYILLVHITCSTSFYILASFSTTLLYSITYKASFIQISCFLPEAYIQENLVRLQVSFLTSHINTIPRYVLSNYYICLPKANSCYVLKYPETIQSLVNYSAIGISISLGLNGNPSFGATYFRFPRNHVNV